MAADRGRTWSDNEVALLLEVWSCESIQEQLRGAVRNEVPFRKITKQLTDGGYEPSSKQCRDKIKSLKKKYKEVVDRLRRSGVGLESDDEVNVRDFRWFNELHAVMKARPVSNPQHVVDSTKATPSNSPSNEGLSLSSTDGTGEVSNHEVCLQGSDDEGSAEKENESFTPDHPPK